MLLGVQIRGENQRFPIAARDTEPTASVAYCKLNFERENARVYYRRVLYSILSMSSIPTLAFEIYMQYASQSKIGFPFPVRDWSTLLSFLAWPWIMFYIGSLKYCRGVDISLAVVLCINGLTTCMFQPHIYKPYEFRSHSSTWQLMLWCCLCVWMCVGRHMSHLMRATRTSSKVKRRSGQRQRCLHIRGFTHI